MPTMQQDSRVEISNSVPSSAEQNQRRRMLIALTVLCLALILVLIKDRQFWFPNTSSESEAQPNAVETPAPAPKSVAPALPQKLETPAATPVRHRTKRPAVTAQAEVPVSPESSPVVTATNRAVLPPLEVEVVAGDQHQTLNPGTNSVNVELQTGSAGRAPGSGSAAGTTTTPSGERVQLSPGTVQMVSRPVEPTYPLLAKQMKVQGAVVLQALIDRSGGIQDIQVLSGPAILSAAAREAVRQWRFKPYFQSGRAVETEARITVNFTISTY